MAPIVKMDGIGWLTGIYMYHIIKVRIPAVSIVCVIAVGSAWSNPLHPDCCSASLSG